MTPRQMQAAFEMEVARHDSIIREAVTHNTELIESHVIFHWLNQAIQRLVKVRYSGTEDGKGFEQTQKRTEDLRTLIKEIKLYVLAGVDGVNKPNSYVAALPNDYLILVDEEVQIQVPDQSGNFTKLARVGVSNCTHDTYSRHVLDPYSEHRLHYEVAKPLRLFNNTTVELVTDGSYTVNYYYLRYIKTPLQITVESDDCDLPEHRHSEVVTKAVTLYLESISDSRYQTSSIESNQNE